MIDSHTHLTSCRDEPGSLVARARQAGVMRMLTVGMDEETNRRAVGLAEAHEEVLAAVGRHPNHASGYDDAAETAIESLCAHPRVRAVGETGLDWYRRGAEPDEQRRAFSSQIAVARRTGLPLVIHMRDSIDDTYAQLDAEAEGVTVILHCFSGRLEHARAAAERGWYCSFAGNATYPRAGELREAAAVVPPELVLVETDAPYLSPQPVRGQANEPANVVHTAAAIAAARGETEDELAAAVEENARRIFGW